MSKLIAVFPNQPSRMYIHISLAGVELHCEPGAEMTLDPVQARTLASLLMHASNEAEMMKMRTQAEEELRTARHFPFYR